MKRLLMLTLLLLAACGTTAVPTDTQVPPPDPDALTLAAVGEEAIGLARKTVPDAVLRQVDVSPDGGAISFRFTDQAATQAIAVHVPGPDVPRDVWRVQVEEFVRFSGEPKGMDLLAVRAGPAAVARSATGHWPGCAVRAMTLFGEGEDLSWIVFCNLPEGVVSGWVDVRSGAFTPSSAPPAVPPPVATAVADPTPESRPRRTSSFAASCVFLYSPETLRDRAFAFDGTVKSVETRVDPKLPTELPRSGSQSQGLPWVTFKVNQWFKGGESPEVAIWVPSHTLEGGRPLEAGDRLLAAGEYRWGQPPEDPLAWGCGFTQPYTPEAAAQWAHAMPATTAMPSIQTATPAPTPVEPVAREALRRIAQAGPGEVVPGFGGLFLDSSDNSIAYVYMLDPSQQEAAEEAAKIILGRQRFEREIREVQVLQGRYSWSQLLGWYRETQNAVSLDDRVYSSDIDERRNRIVFGVATEYTEGQARQALAKTSVPQEAVVFDVAPKHKLDDPPVRLDSPIGVLISLEFERAVPEGQAVSIEVVLTNESDDTVEFDHGIPFHENVMIFTSDGDQVWAKIRGGVLVGTGGTTRLQAGERVRLPTIWDQRDQDGFALPAGRYLVRGVAHIGDVFDGFYRPMDFATEPYELVIQP